jgi:hypothetical protein
MNRNHVYRAGVAAALLVAAGCQAHKKNTSKPLSSEAPAPAEHIALDVAPKPDSTTQPDNLDALTRKAEAYAQAIEAMKRKPTASAPASPDQVQWLNSNEQFSLYKSDPSSANQNTSQPQIDPEVAMVKPVIETTPTLPNTATVATPTPPPVPKGIPSAEPSPQAVAMIDPTKQVAPAPVVTNANVGSNALDERLSRLVKDYPKDVSAQFEYQLLQFLENQQVPEMQVLSSLNSEDKELICAIIDGLSNFRNTLRMDNNMLLSKKVRPILDLAERLRSQAELSIPTLVLCSKVQGFGSYEPMDARFPANKDTQTVVYCEVENFSSQKNDKQLWETKLKQQVVLYTETGMQVWQAEPAVADEAVRTHRRDFFLVKLITIPSSLPIGRYLLKVSVEDEQAHRVAEASLPVLIVAQ